MRNIWIGTMLTLIILTGCGIQTKEEKADQYRQEVLETERAFARMAAKEGVKAAFMAFAADDAVLLRGDRLITGKDAIEKYYGRRVQENVSLAWEPDFIGVAASGDLAYTYGTYHYRAIKTTGDTVHSQGIFHTVWRRGEDGKWKYVWD